jgi:hypothetical protein
MRNSSLPAGPGAQGIGEAAAAVALVELQQFLARPGHPAELSNSD